MSEEKKRPQGRPAMSPEERRKNRNIKLTDEEWQIIQENAKEYGLTASEYIRKKCIAGA